MRVGVVDRGYTMGRPACMRNADTAAYGISVQVFDKFGYLANLTTTLEFAVGIYDRDPGGIVTPVFKTFETL